MTAIRPDQLDPATLWDALSAPQRTVLLLAAASVAEAGGEAFLVGGPVRDVLRHDMRLHDIDIVTTTDARRVAQHFAIIAKAVVAKTTGFGTATVRIPDNGMSVDFATARTETYPHPGALPVVIFPASINEDLHRRDVTVNAMALPITPHGFGALLDPTGGLTDLRAGTIRVLHDATFRDDPTRLYRAVRYAARFGFTVEPHTAALLRTAVAEGALRTISPDRKRHELDLGIREADPVACFAAFDTCGLLRATSPVLIWDDWIATRMPLVAPTAWPVWAFFVCRQDDAALARLLADIPVGRTHARISMLIHVWRSRGVIAHASRLSEVAALLDNLSERVVRALLDGDPAATRAALFYERLHHIRRQDLNWGHSFGNYLKALGITPGPAYGEILRALRNARLDGDVETQADAYAFVRTHLSERDSAR